MALDRLGSEEEWKNLDDQDNELYCRKAMEYGCADLDLMGVAMEMLGAAKGHGQEMAIGFYLMGKVGRMMSAWARGAEPSMDTLNDTVVYAKMLRMARLDRQDREE